MIIPPPPNNKSIYTTPESHQEMFPTGKFEKIGYELLMKYPNFREKYSSLSNPYQIGFLLGLINDYKFSNGKSINTVLEIGVHNGVTSLYMLKEGCKQSGKQFHLYGIDIGDGDFYGQAVFEEASAEELIHYQLHKNSTSFDIEKIFDSKCIDMVFIDGGHSHPHPIMDLIHVLPFLHEESIVLLHDVVDYMRPHAWGESFVFVGWKHKKYRTVHLNTKLEPTTPTTLGCIEIPTDKTYLYDNIESIARIPFRASPWFMGGNYIGINEEHINSLKSFMERHYDTVFAQKIFGLFTFNFNDYNQNFLLYLHETKFYNWLFERSQTHNKDIIDIKKKLEELMLLSKQPAPEPKADNTLNEIMHKTNETHRWMTRIRNTFPYRILQKIFGKS